MTSLFNLSMQGELAVKMMAADVDSRGSATFRLKIMSRTLAHRMQEDGITGLGVYGCPGGYCWPGLILPCDHLIGF